MQLTVLEASRSLPQLIRAALAREEVEVAENGEPVARLVPASRRAVDDAEVGRPPTILAWLRQNPLPKEACRSAEEIDVAIEKNEPAGAWRHEPNQVLPRRT
jgi:prevent-host-death family protein